jgi:hypothetical protein
VECEKKETVCSVKRDFKTKFSNILIKVGGYERFMMGFHVFQSKDDSDAKWKRHKRTPIKVRILDYTNFNKDSATRILFAAIALLTLSSLF